MYRLQRLFEGKWQTVNSFFSLRGALTKLQEYRQKEPTAKFRVLDELLGQVVTED